ncbi:hypothetical protein K439DRAFT_1665556 [Ramaria rubella]|nr:hypothetical protein K439DRAFT_1665556 [Ramaria rubella]
MGLPSSINPAAIYRPALYGTMLSAVLTGINICQTYGYVSSNSDRKLFKVIVILLVLLDLVGSIVITILFDHNVIGGFVDPIALWSLPSYYFLESLGTVTLTTAAQSYTAWSIYILDRRWWPLCVLLLIGIWGQFGVGIFIVERTAHVKTILSFSSGSIRLFTGIWCSIASFADIIATIGLCTLLHTVRTPFKRTDHLINRIMFIFINRGVLVTIVQVLFVVFWFAQPTNLNWTPFYFSCGKIHLTTLRTFIPERLTRIHFNNIDCVDPLAVALLNMRNHTQDQHNNIDSLDGNSYTPKNQSFGQHINQNRAAARLNEAPAVHIARTVEIFNDNGSFPSDADKPDEML